MLESDYSHHWFFTWKFCAMGVVVSDRRMGLRTQGRILRSLMEGGGKGGLGGLLISATIGGFKNKFVLQFPR